MIQNGTIVHLVRFVAADHSVKKIYKADKRDDWSGLVWYGNMTGVPRDSPLCGWNNELCQQDEDKTEYLTVVVSIGVVLFVSVMCCVLMTWKYQQKAKHKALESININWLDVTVPDMLPCGYRPSLSTQVVVLQGNMVMRETAEYVETSYITNTMLKEIIQMQELTNDNINNFIGICQEPGHGSIFMAFASRGSLWEIIEDDTTEFDLDFKTSILTDIACGMAYLPQSSVGAHGWLTSQCCLIDSRWTCRISGYGLKTFRYRQYAAPSAQFWSAPELLENADKQLNRKESDVYSYGIIVQEVILEDTPFAFNDESDPQIIIELVKCRGNPPFRPKLLEGVPESWQQLMNACWEDNPNDRPIFGEILYKMRQIDKFIELTLVEKIIKRLEKHTRKLEELVEQKKIQIRNEHCKAEYLVEELLPKSVVKQLSLGEKVEPETFDGGSLFFSDIVGFTNISSQSSPMQVVELLNNMYTCCDSVALTFDVYKVATIGDAYMVASGIPIRNGDLHAAEICDMALALLEAVQHLTIEHLPDSQLQMRIGIHSGPCVGGIVGIKMPRYLLFGDTVDIASRMESGGHPMKIHISEFTKCLIDHIERFKVVLRGEVDIKGKGLLKTYWLEQ